MSAERDLSHLYPGDWALLLLPLCKPTAHSHGGTKCTARGKRPIELKWQTKAAARLRSGPAGRSDWLEEIVGHVARCRNVGMALPPGVAAIDADDEPAVAHLIALLPDAPRQRTARGAHFLVRLPEGTDLKNRTKVTIAPDTRVDVRVGGGQIVVAPSIHSTGAHYEWEVPLPIERSDIPNCPARLLRKLAEPRRGRLRLDGGVSEGRRNSELARRVGSWLAKGIPPDKAKKRADAFGRRCDPPLDPGEVDRTFRSIVSRHLTSGVEPHRVRRTLNHAGNADRLAQLYRAEIAWARHYKYWYEWDGTRWTPDADDQAMARAKQVAPLIHEQATEALEDGDTAAYEKLTRFAVSSGNCGNLEGTLKAARHLLPLRASELDRPGLLNFQNKTLDLKTLKLHTHDPGDRLTKVANCEFDPDASCPNWNAFLERVQPDPAVRDFFQRAVGYALLGDQREKGFFVVHGPKHSGKTTAINAIRRALGDLDGGGYVATADIKTFIDGNAKGEHNTPGLARLPGARLVVVNEVPAGSELSASLIKSWSGNDMITAMPKYGRMFSFLPQGTLFFVGNDPPVLPYDDDAAWDRVYVVPFTNQIPKREQERDLEDRIAPAAVVAWAVRGLRSYRKVGLRPPKAARLARRRQREEANPIEDYVQQRCELGADRTIPIGELYNDYLEWGSFHRRRSPLTKPAFGKCIARVRGVGKSRPGGQIWMWVGIGLRRS